MSTPEDTPTPPEFQSGDPLAPTSGATPPPPPAPAPPPPPAPGFVQPGPPAGTRTEVGGENATLALVLSIVGLLCCGPLGIVAFVMGNKAKKEADVSGLPLNSTMNIARIIGLVVTILFVLGIIFFAIAAATGGIHFSTGSDTSSYDYTR